MSLWSPPPVIYRPRSDPVAPSGSYKVSSLLCTGRNVASTGPNRHHRRHGPSTTPKRPLKNRGRLRRQGPSPRVLPLYYEQTRRRESFYRLSFGPSSRDRQRSRAGKEPSRRKRFLHHRTGPGTVGGVRTKCWCPICPQEFTIETPTLRRDGVPSFLLVAVEVRVGQNNSPLRH